MTDKEKLEAILELAASYGGYDGQQHKQYALDQIIRIVTGDGYESWVAEYEGDPEDEENHYSWDVGTA